MSACAISLFLESFPCCFIACLLLSPLGHDYLGCLCMIIQVFIQHMVYLNVLYGFSYRLSFTLVPSIICGTYYSLRQQHISWCHLCNPHSFWIRNILCLQILCYCQWRYILFLHVGSDVNIYAIHTSFCGILFGITWSLNLERCYVKLALEIL